MAIDDIAVSGEEIFNELFDRSIQIGLVSRRFDKGRLGLLYSVFAAEFEDLIAIFNEYTKQFSLETITDEALLESFLKQYVVREVSSRAKVMLEFTREPGYNEAFTVPQGFSIKEGTGGGAVFETAESLFIPKGVQRAKVLGYSIEVGSIYNIGPNQLEYLTDRDYITKVSVTNPKSAWGGRDDEPLEDARKRALNFRYKREGTSAHIMEQIEQYSNLEFQEYNILEYIEGYGSVGIVLLVDNDYEYEDLVVDLEQNKISGINYQFIRGKKIYTDLNIVISLSGNKDLTPTEEQEVFDLVDNTIRDFFGIGVQIGRDVSLNLLQNSLNSALSTKYRNVINILINSANELVNITNNVIKVSQDEIIRPNRIITSINLIGG